MGNHMEINQQDSLIIDDAQTQSEASSPDYKLNIKDDYVIIEEEEEDEEEEEIIAREIYDRFGFLLKNPNKVFINRNDDINNNESKTQLKHRLLLENSRTEKWIEMVNNWNYYLTNEKVLYKRLNKGIPAGMRGSVWKLISGNSESDENRNDKFQQLVTSSYEGGNDELNMYIDKISRDLQRTFPNHILFDQKHYGQQALDHVLRAYAVYDLKKVGYCQGMGFVVGLLLCYLDECSAFYLFKKLMTEKPWKMDNVYDAQMIGAQRLLHQYEFLLKKHCYSIYKHLENLSIVPSMYCVNWFITILSYSFPFSLVLRVWDLFLVYGWPIVFQVVISSMKLNEKIILQSNFEENLMFFKKMPSSLKANVIMQYKNRYINTITQAVLDEI